jgi:WD40 repeat protein
VQSELAQENAEKAEKQALIATERAAEADKQTRIAGENLVKAEEANAKATIQTRIATEQAAAAKIAQAQAEESKKEADKSAIAATEQAEAAKKAQAAADIAADRANRLRLQSVAQSMAIKASGIPERDLKAVVAKQAYDFYQEYGDPEKAYNGDIYAGVYSGLVGVLSDFTVTETDDGKSETTYRNNGDSILNQYHGHLPIKDELTGAEKTVAVRSVAFSEDGKRMYSAGSDGRLLVWDYASGKRTYTELYSKSHVNRVVNLSPDERYLALGTDDNHILVIDLKKRDEAPISIDGHVGGTIYDLVFTPDSKNFISSGADSRILLHNLKTKQTVQVAQTSARAKALALSPDGKTLAAGTESGEVMIIDLSDPQFKSRNIYRKNGGAVQAIHFSFGGTKLAFGDDNGDLVIWDLEEKRRWGPKLTGFTSPITDVHFSPDDNLLAATSRDKTARMWDLKNIYDLPTVFDDHQDWVWTIDFHPDGTQFATGSADGKIRIFETKPDAYADQICGLVSANMSETQWRQYVGDPAQIPYVNTCEGLDKAEETE